MTPPRAAFVPSVRNLTMSTGPQPPSTPASPLPKLAIAVGTTVVAAAAGYVIRNYLRGPVRRTPPEPEEDPTPVVFGKIEGRNHGDESQLMTTNITRDDPFFWMRDDDRKDKRVLKHLRQENAYTNWMTMSLKPYAKDIYKEMLSHLKEDDVTVPAKKGAFKYYSKTVAGKSYKYFCRKAILDSDQLGEEQLLLDVNQIAAGQKYCEVGATEISPEGDIFAYSVDQSGYETYQICFLHLESGKLLHEDAIAGTTGSIEWGKDGSEVYYKTFDDAHRPDKVWRHKMKSGPYAKAEFKKEKDACLYEEKDTEFSLYMSKSLSGRFLFLSSYASTYSEHQFIDLDNPDKGVRLIKKRETNVLYDVTHAQGDTFYVLTNAEGATNFKVMKTDIAETTNWTEFIPYERTRKIDDVECFKDFVALQGRQNGYKEIWMVPRHNPELMYQIPVEESAHTVRFGSNYEYETDVLRYNYSSLITPVQTREYDVKMRTSKLLKEVEVPNYDRSIYRTERIEAKSSDGVTIPMSVVYNANAVQANSANRLHLYGYGSYEVSIDPSFSMGRLPLLDRGIVFVIAHIRGGGEYGREWYEAAKFETKKKTFEDFCACAEHLVKTKRTTPDLMSMEGRSAGGLLMGAVMNMRPDLFKAAIAGVPFVDVLNTMSDPSIPLTTGEWQEWGNPHQQKYFDAIKEYCPYTNVGAKPYPAVLILAGLYDPRVLYSEPAKWAAKLRKYSTNNEPVLLKVDMSSGHFSASNRYKNLEDRSFELAWLMRELGAPDKAL